MTNDDMLSQEEIDALLRGSDNAEEEQIYKLETYIDEMEKDALGEIGNISFGSSATALSTLLNLKVSITTPEVSIIEKQDLKNEFPHPNVAIQVKYTAGFSGVNLLVIKQSDAAIIADIMLGGDGRDPSDMLGDIQLSAVQETMNQMMGSAATSMSTIFGVKVDISPPSIDLLNIHTGEGKDSIPPDNLLVKISFRLKVGELIDSQIMQLLTVDFAKELVGKLKNSTGSQPGPIEDKDDDSVYEEKQYEKAAARNEHNPAESPGDPSILESGSRQRQAQEEHISEITPNRDDSKSVHIQQAHFSPFNTQSQTMMENSNLDMLLDIPLQVTVELGRTKRSVKELLELSGGSIIELDKLAGEPVDILVNNKPVAKGEVVVIDENFGVRVTDIVSQSDRLKKLR